MSGELRARLAKSGQGHLLRYYDELLDVGKRTLVEQLEAFDFDELNSLFRRAKDSEESGVTKLDEKMEPMPEDQIGSVRKCSEEELERYRGMGLEEVSLSRVGVVLMAGGQGTRLGVDYPKGQYDVGLPSGKSLFQIQGERIRRLQEIASDETGRCGVITWYIMTSEPTDQPTKDFFRKKGFFGLEEKNVVFFQQGVLPCFDMDGKIFLENKGKVAVAPNGNGGIYRAMKETGVLEDMQKRGVKHVHIHSVDNILTKVADPTYIGFCMSKNAQCAAKVIPKLGPKEGLGVVSLVDGRYQVVEYSEITEETASLRKPNGELVFNTGSICNHYFTTAFLWSVACMHLNDFPLHVAKKKIPHVDETGATIKPTQPNGIKIELFIFDAFPFTKSFVVWEVRREEEFSALKNADDAGTECPKTARADLLRLHKTYIEKAGGQVNGDEVEISPLLSYEGEGLEKRVAGKTLASPGLLRAEDEPQCAANGH